MRKDLEDGINIKNSDTLAGRVLIGFECTECGNRVRKIGDGRLCEDCSNIVWDKVVG